jgi:O-antigen/teichoic acid export membrane protein
MIKKDPKIIFLVILFLAFFNFRMTKSRFLKDNVIFMSGTILAGALGYLFHFFVARRLSVSEYGEMQSVFALVAMTGVFASGFSYFVIKYSSLFAAKNDYFANSEFISYLNKKILKAVVAISILLLVFSPFIRDVLHLSDIWGIIAGIGAIFFGTIVVAFQESLRAWQKFFVISLIGVTGAATKLIFGYGFASFFGKASPVIFSLTLSSVFVWLLVLYFWKRMKRDARRGENRRWEEYVQKSKIWKNAIQIFVFSFASAFILNIDVLLVKSLTTSEMAGYYGALSTLGKIILLLNVSVVGVVLPQACKDGHEGKRLRPKIFLVSLLLMIAIGLTITAVFYLIPGALMSALFGQKYQSISGSLWLFGVLALILSLLRFETDLAFARHDFRINWLLLFTAIVMSLAIYLFHSTLSNIAVSVIVSLLIGYFLAVVLNNFFDNKKLSEPLI